MSVNRSHDNKNNQNNTNNEEYSEEYQKSLREEINRIIITNDELATSFRFVANKNQQLGKQLNDLDEKIAEQKPRLKQIMKEINKVENETMKISEQADLYKSKLENDPEFMDLLKKVKSLKTARDHAKQQLSRIKEYLGDPSLNMVDGALQNSENKVRFLYFKNAELQQQVILLQKLLGGESIDYNLEEELENMIELDKMKKEWLQFNLQRNKSSFMRNPDDDEVADDEDNDLLEGKSRKPSMPSTPRTPVSNNKFNPRGNSLRNKLSSALSRGNSSNVSNIDLDNINVQSDYTSANESRNNSNLGNVSRFNGNRISAKSVSRVSESGEDYSVDAKGYSSEKRRLGTRVESDNHENRNGNDDSSKLNKLASKEDELKNDPTNNNNDISDHNLDNKRNNEKQSSSEDKRRGSKLSSRDDEMKNNLEDDNNNNLDNKRDNEKQSSSGDKRRGSKLSSKDEKMRNDIDDDNDNNLDNKRDNEKQSSSEDKKRGSKLSSRNDELNMGADENDLLLKASPIDSNKLSNVEYGSIHLSNISDIEQRSNPTNGDLRPVEINKVLNDDNVPHEVGNVDHLLENKIKENKVSEDSIMQNDQNYLSLENNINNEGCKALDKRKPGDTEMNIKKTENVSSLNGSISEEMNNQEGGSSPLSKGSTSGEMNNRECNKLSSPDGDKYKETSDKKGKNLLSLSKDDNNKLEKGSHSSKDGESISTSATDEKVSHKKRKKKRKSSESENNETGGRSSSRKRHKSSSVSSGNGARKSEGRRHKRRSKKVLNDKNEEVNSEGHHRIKIRIPKQEPLKPGESKFDYEYDFSDGEPHEYDYEYVSDDDADGNKIHVREKIRVLYVDDNDASVEYDFDYDYEFIGDEELPPAMIQGMIDINDPVSSPPFTPKRKDHNQGSLGTSDPIFNRSATDMEPIDITENEIAADPSRVNPLAELIPQLRKEAGEETEESLRAKLEELKKQIRAKVSESLTLKKEIEDLQKPSKKLLIPPRLGIYSQATIYISPIKGKDRVKAVNNELMRTSINITDLLGSEIEKDEKILKKQNEDLANLRSQQEQLQKAKEEIANLDKQIEQASLDKINKQQKIQQLNDELKNLSGEIAKFEENNKKELEITAVRNKELEEVNKRVNIKRAEYQKLMGEISLRQNHIRDMNEYLARIEKQLNDLSARVRPEIRTLLDDVKGSKQQLEATQAQVAEKAKSVEEKRKQLTLLQDSAEMNMFRVLRLQRLSLERRVRKWQILKESQEPFDKIEQFSQQNQGKRNSMIKILKQAEEELIKKQEEKVDLEQYAKLLDDMLSKHKSQ